MRIVLRDNMCHGKDMFKFKKNKRSCKNLFVYVSNLLDGKICVPCDEV
jgi:hypothetical protein